MTRDNRKSLSAWRWHASTENAKNVVDAVKAKTRWPGRRYQRGVHQRGYDRAELVEKPLTTAETRCSKAR
ncbi:hypothetical protein, partial [Candidatus Skiveiella danica]|uniref:hypothetical protein n=1 Tax=Candidatus Skiveiella danica TaxID=3386177 RepID=UPI0039B8D26B